MGQRIPIVILGEKDHGKSTLLGRLLYETRTIPQDRLREIQKAVKTQGGSFEWAHLLDSFRYERERKMTLDTTRAVVALGKNLYEFIDVPGHKKLIKNMMTGASDAQCGILVIDIKKGITPQTIKHLEIAKFLGMKKAIIAVNKVDKVKYSAAEFKRAVNIFSKALQKYGIAEKTLFVPTAALQGENIIKKSHKLSWFRGPTLQRAIQISFKRAHRTDNELHISRRTRNFKAVCLFVEKPRKNLLLESHSQILPISKINEIKAIHSVETTSFQLKKRGTPSEKFVIKTNGKIIGICRRAL